MNRRRSLSFGHGTLVLSSLLAVAACGGGPEPGSHAKSPKTDSSAGVAGSLNPRHDFVETKLKDARTALRSGEPRKARDLAEEARRAADEDELRVVLAFVDDIDKYESKAIAAEANELAKGGKCGDAMDTVASAVKKVGQSSAFLKALRSATQKTITECVQHDIDAAIQKHDFVLARSTVESPAATVALDEAVWKELSGKLHEGIVTQLLARIDKDVAAGRYESAVKAIAEEVSKGEVGPEEEQDALESMRKILGPRQLEAVTQALGSPARPDAVLGRLDDLTKLLKWNLPAELVEARRALVVWVEAATKAHASALPKPQPRFTYGKTEIRPSDSIAGAVKTTLPTARKVWVIAQSGALALVATDEPKAGPLADRLLAAAGWVPATQLKAEDTADWLLSGQELVGQRVFAPLRENDKLLYLGVVEKLEGANVIVRRVADDKPVKVPSASLRSGRLTAGTRVLTTCGTQLRVDPARVERELPQGKVSVVQVTCITKEGDGKTKDEVPGSLASKVEWLPPRRP